MQKTSLTPKFFFMSLGVIVTLITSVSSFLLLFFETLNKKFPDVLNSVYQYGYNTTTFDSIRGPLATLIIVFPVFLILAYFWSKQSKSELGNVDMIICKWMIYLILFLAGIVVIVDLVTLVRYFVAGEITNRFVYKVLGTLITSLIVGNYFYISEFWHGKEIIKKLNRIINPVVSIILVILVIVYSFIIMGSPAKQRLLRFDERRVSDLQNIQYQVINYWQQKEKLPTSLSELVNPISSFSIPVDPEFEKGKVYEYIPKDKLSFELCATFSQNMPKGWQEYNYGGGVMPMYAEKDIAVSSYPYPGGGINDSWDHKDGRTCFTRTIDIDIYPPFKK